MRKRKKKRNYQHRVLYQVKFSFINEHEMKNFQCEWKWKDFVTTWTYLQMVPRDVFHTEAKMITMLKPESSRLPSKRTKEIQCMAW